MRLLIFTLLFSLQASGQFVFPAVMSSPGETPPAPITGERTLISDDFSGSTLNSRWNVRRPDKQTISVSGGYLNVSTNTDTIAQRSGFLFSNLNAQAMIYDTSYGLTAIRNYTMEIGFMINALGDTAIGNILGTYSPFVVTSLFTNFSHIQFSNPDTLRLLAGKDTCFAVPPQFDDDITGQIDFNTSDYYVFRHRVYEDWIVTTIVNRTQSDSIVRYWNYNFAHGAYPLRSNFFYFTFGSMGRTNVKYDYITVTTTEELNPTWLVVGDSRPTGYNSGSADSAYANMLKRNTNDSVQIWAGGGMSIASVLQTLPRMKEVNASKYILDFGTNDVFDATFQTKFTQFTDSLTSWGKTYYIMYQPNKGDPVAGTSMNKWYKDNYPTHIIDNWTDPGYATKTIGNGMMYDGVHETLLGMQTTYQIVKAALSAFFPL